MSDILYNKLFDWQKNILNKYISQKRYGLFLDMGLGKTILSLAFAEKHNSEKILVITIKSKSVEKIEDEGSWQYWCKFGGYTPLTKKDNFNEDNIALITNYDSIYDRKNKKEKSAISNYMRDFLILCKNKKVTVILDESHNVKTASSLRSLAIKKIITGLEAMSSDLHVYLLTGTPFTNGFIDLYNQLKLLGCDMTKTAFIDNYCIRGNYPSLLSYQQPIIGYKNIDDLYKLIHKYSVTIKSEEVINLPNKIFKNIKLPVSDEFKLFTKDKIESKNLNKELKKRNLPLINTTKMVKNVFYRNIDYPNMNFFAETITSFWIRCRQLSIGFVGNEENYNFYNKERFEKLEELLKEHEDNYVLFYNYTPELFEIYTICEKLGYNIDVYCGDIKSTLFYEKYSKQSREQQLTNKKNIIISNFASGSTGMNWQLYNKCILFSIPTFDDYEQSIKRINRIGQKEPCFYYMFYQDNWLDKSMLKSLEEKKNYNKDMFEYDLNNN